MAKIKRLKMSNRMFRTLLIIPLVFLLLIALILNVVGTLLKSTLDTYVGAGTISIQNPKGTESWDTNYYNVLYGNGDEAAAAAYEVALRVAAEGSTLLKNNGILPLAAGSRVMPFGYAYLQPIYGQLTSGGSAKWVIDPITPEQGLAAFTIDDGAAKLMQAAGAPEIIIEAPGTIVAGESTTMLGGDCKIYEYDPSIYANLSAAIDTTGIVFVTRSGQEGQDQKYDAYEDGTKHYLALTENEKGAIRAAKETCGQVIVVLVSSAPMEMGILMEGELEADAILWVGHPGEQGFATLSGLLTGEINPSGRTVDIWTADFTENPTYQNLGTFAYSNLKAERPDYAGGMEEYDRPFTEYQEGVYMGYRYYETAAALNGNYAYGKLDGKGAFTTAGAVCYPFGYGLSYTTFEQELLGVTEKGGTYTATVKVTNTGSLAGKEVVQLYVTAPYSELDAQNRIEKPAAYLVAFDKTELLAANASETVTLTFTSDDLTSYCYTHQNPDGTVGCYILEEGDYIVSLRANSHDVLAEETITVSDTVWYDGSDMNHIRQREITAQSVLDDDGNAIIGQPLDSENGYVAATNQFQTSSDYMNTDSVILSRTDWNGTQPAMPEGRTKEISPQFAGQLGIESSFDVETDPVLGNVEGSLVYAAEAPVSNARNGLTLADLRGAAYDDPRWDTLLDQIDWNGDKDGIQLSFAGAAYITGAVPSIGLPQTEENDGANGLKIKGAGDGGYDMTKSSSFGFAPLMAATWNVDLLYEVGAAFGQESLQHGLNGWYCPAINLHRSVFNGRVFEYYSEDPVLSGKLAASVISGAGDQGMFCYIKHFALNDTDTNRDRLCNYWADEQTMRELYFKAFEIAIEEARMTIGYISDENGTLSQKTMRAATAVMPAQNCVGTVVGHANYPLLNNVLRGEWGFRGVVVSDYWVWNGNNLRDLCLRAGCDTYLCIYMPVMWNVGDYDSATARSVMRTALHNLAYTTVNSNAMQGAAPGATFKQSLSPWQIGLYGFDVVVVLLFAGAIFLMVRRTKDEKAHPENYKRKVKKARKGKEA